MEPRELIGNPEVGDLVYGRAGVPAQQGQLPAIHPHPRLLQGGRCVPRGPLSPSPAGEGRDAALFLRGGFGSWTSCREEFPWSVKSN